MHKQALKSKAEKLRTQGYSYNIIAEKIDVSKGTLHSWLAKIPYHPNQEVIERIGNARARSGEVKSQQKRESIEKAHRLALKDISGLNKRDLFMVGIGLYLGEGAKSGNFIRIINADPAIINLSIQWFQKVCHVPFENLSLAIHLYPDNNIEACLKYWSEITGISRKNFGKTQVDHRIGKKMGKRGKLKYGTAHLSVKSKGDVNYGAFLRRRIDGWMKIVLSENKQRD